MLISDSNSGDPPIALSGASDDEPSPPLLDLKPRRPPFDYSRGSNKETVFLHPGYPDQHNILFKLPALDSGGVHHELARVACAILADCRWDGFLSLTKDGPRISQAEDGILTAPFYYFRIEDDVLYPVVPSFDNFTCPTVLPSSWREAKILIPPGRFNDISKRDQTCRITGSSLPIENAHIIPQAKMEWWDYNGMSLRAKEAHPAQGPYCSENMMLLRRDLHKMWDDNWFAIVPKAGKWVVQALWTRPMVELERYHNLEMQPLSGVSHTFLLCRFALAVLSRSMFLGQGVERRLVTLVPSEEPGRALVRRCIKNLAMNEYLGMLTRSTRSKSRSQSPKKRQRSTDVEEDGATDTDDDGDDESESDEDYMQRGRPRKRRCDEVLWRDNTCRLRGGLLSPSAPASPSRG